jgi:glutamine amidotransferase/cyclase
MGICIGMQVLFESSEESPNVQGLAVLRGRIQRFSDTNKAVPHMGWNKTTVIASDDGQLVNQKGHDVTDYYFVHSFAHLLDTYSAIPDFVYSITKYGDQTFTSAVSCGNIFATQFHPEKSGYAGLAVLKAFLSYTRPSFPSTSVTTLPVVSDHLSKRIIACLDVRSNDAGDLVVTKGDQYDVRERSTDGAVRNLGKPIDLACRYFAEGADEITFLNITSFRQCPLGDLPMMEILRKVSETIFVPLTIGGGIREFAVDQPDGKQLRYSALEVADAYFRSGADKVSIGSDAVYAAEAFWNHLNRQDLATMERVALVHNEPSLVKKAKDTAISLISSK